MTTAIRCLVLTLLLGWLAAGEPASGGEEQLGTNSSLDDEASPIFIAPFFVSVRFAQDVQRQLERLRIVDERETQVYRDFKTGLMWATRDNGKDIGWKKATIYCQSLGLAGYEDWRLPTIEELENLHQKMSQALYKTPREIRLSACCPWSSTLRADNSGWNFSFRFRKRFSGTLTYSFDLRALCARGMTADELPASKKERKAARRSDEQKEEDLRQDS